MVNTVTFDQLPDLEPLTEVRLSEVYEALASSRVAAGIISAYQHTPDVTAEQNHRNNRALGAELQNAGFGHCWLDCEWQSDAESILEVAILVTADKHNQHRLFEALMAAANKYNQKAFVYGQAGIGKPICVFNCDGKEVDRLINVRLDDIFASYSTSRSVVDNLGTFTVQTVRSPVGFFGKLAGIKD